MATIVLTAVGTALGGPVGGAIGALLGQAADQRLFAPAGRQGPRLSDLKVQTSAYGTQIPALFGAMRVAGTVIWATDLKETRQKSGGKGRPSVTTFSYSASFAVALSCRALRSVGRIWADGNLLRGGAGDFKTEIGAFRLHLGDEDQPADPLIASAEGIAVTPACRGMAYVVFEDLQLADYGNRIPSLTFEVIADDGAVSVGEIGTALTGGGLSGEAAPAVDGYAASGSDARAALAPLVESHGLRLREGEDGLVLEGGAVLSASLARESRVSRVNGGAVTPLTHRRDPAESVPKAYALRHYDAARDYQAGLQKAERPGPGRRAEQVDLPALMSAGRAKALAGERIAAAWKGRGRLELMGGWDMLGIAAGQVVAVEGADGLWSVEAREWEAMGVHLSLRQIGSGRVEELAASPGSAVSPPDLVHGTTSLMIVELPGLGDDVASAPIVAVAAAGASSGWRRAALFTVEPGSGEAVPAGSTAGRAVMGTVLAAPGQAEPGLFDLAGHVDVELLATDMALFGADDAALLRGGNLCLVGGELIQFGAVAALGGRRFRLSRLLRGRRGTEWAMAGHAAGESFLLIEAETLASAPAGAVRVGGRLDMLAIGIGDAVPATASVEVAGEALRPLAPVRLRCMPDGAGGLVIDWVRRSRCGWDWFDGTDAPLGEEQERYLLRLMDGAVEVRRAELDAAQFHYDAAMAAADAAAGHPGPLEIEVSQIGARAMGRPARAALTGI